LRSSSEPLTASCLPGTEAGCRLSLLHHACNVRCGDDGVIAKKRTEFMQFIHGSELFRHVGQILHS